MKRYIRLLGVLLILFSSCSDFLEEKSQDLIIPKSVKDYREFLFGEAYIRDETQIHTYLDIMTDDVKENIKGSFLGGRYPGQRLWLLYLAGRSGADGFRSDQ